MKIWLDDDLENRPTPDGYIRCFTPNEVIDHIKNGEVELIDLDNDLGFDMDGNPIPDGLNVVKWLERETFLNNDFNPPEIVIHSANPIAKNEMLAGKSAIERFLQNRNV